MKAFITGITGFAGGHLAEHLLDCGDDVMGCSRSGRWRLDAPAALTAINVLPLDLATPFADPLAQRLRQFNPNVVYHLAGISIPRVCGGKTPTAEAMSINVDAAARILDIAASVPSQPRVVLVSSAHVYWPQSPQRHVVDETAPLNPAEAYAQTKLLAEQAAAHRAGDVDYVIARAFQHTGPRQQPPMMLPQWCSQLARGKKPLKIYTRDALLDLSDVRDVVRAYRLLAIHGQRTEVYNVGGGIARRSGDVLQRLLGRIDPTWPVVETQPGEKFNPIANTEKLHVVTTWQPQIALATTLADTWNYWQARGELVT